MNGYICARITTAFNFNVYSYLMQEGYTHLHLKGLQPVMQAGDSYNYVVPLKKDDLRIADLEWDGLAVSLDAEETLQLLEQYTVAKVIAEWTVAELAAFLLVLNGQSKSAFCKVICPRNIVKMKVYFWV